MYKAAQIRPTENKETIAGICPKFDDGSKHDPPKFPDPEKQTWPLCGEVAGSLCTFPFLYGTELFYEPFKDSQGVSRCGTKDTSDFPIEYASVNDLDIAVPCSGKYS